MNFDYKLTVSAKDQSEADQKAQALQSLASQLDGKTLSAMAKKVPSILKDPIQSVLIKKKLGI